MQAENSASSFGETNAKKNPATYIEYPILAMIIVALLPMSANTNLEKHNATNAYVKYSVPLLSAPK